jgi:release factor glutamine methyltransferase
MSDRFVNELQKELIAILKDRVENPAKEAQLLMMHHTGQDALWMLLNPDAVVVECESVLSMAKRRAAHEPLEYITKSVSFYSQEFFIEKGALIPRPETELLIDDVLANIADHNAPMHIVEVGVGSGIVSIMLAKLLPNATITAIDISKDALQIAQKNIELHGVQQRVALQQGSLLDGVEVHIDYLVSNPPYIAQDAELEPNLAFEPNLALYGGEKGNEIVLELLRRFLNKEIKTFSCEIGYDQKDTILEFLTPYEGAEIKFYKDWSHFDRGFTIRKQT